MGGKKVTLGQSKSIFRCLGKMTGKYPEDPIEAASVDAVMDGLSDLTSGVFAAGNTKDARLKYLDKAGKGGKLLAKIEAFLGDEKVQGQLMTQLMVFQVVANVAAGSMDHVDISVLDNCKNIMAICKKVGKMPKVVEFYKKECALKGLEGKNKVGQLTRQ